VRLLHYLQYLLLLGLFPALERALELLDCNYLMVALVDLIVKLPVLRVVKVLHNEVDELGESGCPCRPTFLLWHLIDIGHVVP